MLTTFPSVFMRENTGDTVNCVRSIYRAILQNESIKCTDYDRTDHGVDLQENDQFVAVVLSENLIALIDETTMTAAGRSIL